MWPEQFSLGAYEHIFSTSALVRALMTTVLVTVVGTVVQLILTVTMAYPLAKRNLRGRRLILSLAVFAMVFSGGMIPTFLLVKDLGLLNSYWALILPAATNPFSLIIIKNFFQELPAELEESAKMNGATEVGILWRILLPLSEPVPATFALFYAIGIWNDFMSPLLYLSDIPAAAHSRPCPSPVQTRASPPPSACCGGPVSGSVPSASSSGSTRIWGPSVAGTSPIRAHPHARTCRFKGFRFRQPLVGSATS